MADYSDLVDPIQAALDVLHSELHAHRRDTAGGHPTSLRRRLSLEGLEIACTLMLHQLEALAVGELEAEGIDLADPIYYTAERAPGHTKESDRTHLGGI